MTSRDRPGRDAGRRRDYESSESSYCTCRDKSPRRARTQSRYRSPRRRSPPRRSLSRQTPPRSRRDEVRDVLRRSSPPSSSSRADALAQATSAPPAPVPFAAADKGCWRGQIVENSSFYGCSSITSTRSRIGALIILKGRFGWVSDQVFDCVIELFSIFLNLGGISSTYKQRRRLQKC